METKYTKGPWHIDNPKGTGRWQSISGNGEYRTIYATNDDLELIAYVKKDYMLAHKDQNLEANAKLIAAAPDMLDALIYLYNYAGVWDNLPQSAKDKIEQVISIATNTIL